MSLKNCLKVAILSVVFTGCFKKEEIKKLDYPALEPGWGVPLINSKLYLKDLAAVIDPEIGISQEPDNSYTFNYFDTIVSPAAEELLILPDQSFEEALDFPGPITGLTFPITAPPAQGTYQGKEIFDPGNGGKFKSASLTGGNLAMNFQNRFLHDVSITITLFSLLDNAMIPVVKTVSLPSLSSGQVIIPLEGHTLKLSENNDDFNNFKYQVLYTITPTGNEISQNDNVSISMMMKDLKYSLIIGDIGQITFPDYKGKIDIKAFEQASLGNIHFAHAKLKLTFDNYFGIPVTFTINKLKSTTFYEKEVDITPENPRFNIFLSAPTLTELGQFRRSQVVLDSNNSKITDAVNPAPNSLEYDFSTSLTSGLNNYISNKSVVKVYSQLEIPLKGHVSYYEIKDTVPIEKLPSRVFNDSSVEGNIDSAIFKLKFENELPLNASVQLQFLDKDYQPLDSLLINGNNAIASNNVAPSTGVVTAPTVTEKMVSMSGTRYDNIYNNAVYYYLYLRFKTSENPSGQPINITLQANNSIRVMVSVLTKGKIKIK